MVGLVKIAESFQYIMRNPFGLEFKFEDNEPLITVRSAINLLGYNDYLERVIGVSRAGFALLALAYSQNTKERVIAAGHVFRGILEMMGSFEAYLLVLDIAFTIFNVGNKMVNKSAQNNQQGTATIVTTKILSQPEQNQLNQVKT